MSKASEYAERVKAASGQPKFYIGDGMDLFAWADSMGQLYCCGGKTLAPAEALAFAAWIQETFGETGCQHRVVTTTTHDPRILCADCGAEVKP